MLGDYAGVADARINLRAWNRFTVPVPCGTVSRSSFGVLTEVPVEGLESARPAAHHARNGAAEEIYLRTGRGIGIIGDDGWNAAVAVASAHLRCLIGAAAGLFGHD
jgi:hypothetical protein